MNLKTNGKFILAGLLAMMPLASSMALAKQRPPLWEGKMVEEPKDRCIIPPAPGTQIRNETLTGALIDFIVFLPKLQGNETEIDKESVRKMIGETRDVDVLVRSAKAGEVLSEKAVRKALRFLVEFSSDSDWAPPESIEIEKDVTEAIKNGTIKAENAAKVLQEVKEKLERIVAATTEAKVILLAAKTK